MKNFYIAGIVKEDSGSGYSVYFPDVPNVCACGRTIQEAIVNASDGLFVALRALVEKNQPLPAPSDMETVKEKVREIRIIDELPYPEDTLYQYFSAPAAEMAPVRVNITVPKSILEEIDNNAKLAGMSRSGFLVAAAQAYSV